MKVKKFLVTLLLLFSGQGFAQNMIEAEITGQPLSYQKEGVVTGCGIRVFSLIEVAGAKPGRVIDVSFNLWNNGSSLVKGMMSEYDTLSVQKEPKRRSLPINKVWLKAPNVAATHPLDNKFKPGEDTNSILYSTSLDSVLDLFLTVLDSRPISIGIQRQGDKSERIYFGQVKLSAAEVSQAKMCLDEALKTPQK
jgi:hypothetical protein